MGEEVEGRRDYENQGRKEGGGRPRAAGRVHTVAGWRFLGEMEPR